MEPITLIAPRGLGDAIVSLPSCYAYAARGHRVNLLNQGAVNWAAHLPVLCPVGTEREGRIIDCGSGFRFHTPWRMLAQTSLAFGVYPLAIPAEPWLRRLPEHAETVAQMGLPREYIAVFPRGSQVNRRLEPWQVAPLAERWPVVVVHDAHLAGMPGIDWTGRTTIPQMVAVIAEARAMVAVDSGPLHTAGAFGTPLLGTIGGTIDPRSFCEDYRPSRWLLNDASWELPPDEIIDELETLLAETEGRECDT